MGLTYRCRVYSIAEDIHSATDRYSKYEYASSSNIPPGFARNCMMRFLHERGGEWFIDNGIAISVETFVDQMTYQYRGDIVAHMTPEQKHAWEKQEFIRKLST